MDRGKIRLHLGRFVGMTILANKFNFKPKIDKS